MAPTGVDPVTFRFSVIQRGISHSVYMGDILLIRYFSDWSQLVAVGFRAENGPEMAQKWPKIGQSASGQLQTSEPGVQLLPETSSCKTMLMKVLISSPARSTVR